MLELKGLRKSWSDFGLDVSLRLEDAEIAAVLGPSGSGKSTLLRLIAGLEGPDSGEVVVDGREVSSLAPERRGIGMVFQDFALFPQMSVRRNIEYGPRMARQGRAAREAKVERIARAFEIEALLERGPRSLSGGEQQRVALARALAADPGIILLDEPLSSLDAALRRRLRGEIGSGLREAGKTALLVTHDAREAFAIADRIFVMGSGSIVEEGRAEDIYERPAKAFTARLLGEGPVLPCEIVGSEGERLAARTPIGDFLCPPPRSGYALGERVALFFPASAAALAGTALASAGEKAGRMGRFRGRLVSTAYEGRCLSATLDCGGPGLRGARIEIELPVGLDAKRGDELEFSVPEGRAVLVAEDR